MTHPLVEGLPERWASEWGEDRWGAFMGFTVGEVTQLFRWIPPGWFLMGSPNGEAGRSTDEGPQHEVTISTGYWLGETPVTQSLWEAVMGKGNNPSRFKSAQRPVEQVRWGECKEFIARLNTMIHGLEARLPTEAEWEYGCRANTMTATWAGDLKFVGENNAPLLNEIAWYGGNSGEGFELYDGVDSRGWPGKQIEHMIAGTREVRNKRPNIYGLYDMLGNVWEWCEDRYGAYEARAVTDPLGAAMGTHRVFRGGAWFSLAKYVRAAQRYASAPDYHDVSLGFRLARGQQGQEPGAEPGPRSGPSLGAGRDAGPAVTREAALPSPPRGSRAR